MACKQPSETWNVVQAVLSKGEVMQLAPYIAGTLNLEAASVGNALAKALAALADKQANPRPEPMLKLSHQCRYTSKTAH